MITLSKAVQIEADHLVPAIDALKACLVDADDAKSAIEKRIKALEMRMAQLLRMAETQRAKENAAKYATNPKQTFGQKVVALLMMGKSINYVAQELGVSVQLVNTAKSQARNRLLSKGEPVPNCLNRTKGRRAPSPMTADVVPRQAVPIVRGLWVWIYSSGEEPRSARIVGRARMRGIEVNLADRKRWESDVLVEWERIYRFHPVTGLTVEQTVNPIATDPQ